MDEKKSNVLIDTDVLINFFDKNKKFYQIAQNAFYGFPDRNEEPCISIITEIEIIQGAKNNADKNNILKSIESFNTILLSDNICPLARDLIITYSSSHDLLLADAFIASTALFFDIELYTFNKKDFQFIKDLKLYAPDDIRE